MRVIARRAARGSVGILLAGVIALASGCDGGGASSSSAGKKTAGAGVQALAVSVSGSSTGEGAEYVYDGAGNLLEIRAASASAMTVSIVDFEPRQGGVGQVVTVTGVGFSPVAVRNTVQLGGVPVTVLSATASQLSFEVPAGAVTGRITVGSGGQSATSAADFTVVTEVIISDFTPKMGRAGDVVTITGYNFDPSPAGNSVSIGGGAAAVTGGSRTALLAMVGTAATSGLIAVSTSSGSATSAEDFYVLPDEYVPWDIGFAERASEGSSSSVELTELDKTGLVLFDGVQGEYFTLYASENSFAGATTLAVYAPGNTLLFSGTVSTTEAKLVLPALPSTGAYLVVVEPAMTSVGSLSLQVIEDDAAVLQMGQATAISLVKGQNGRYTLSASAGDYLGLALSGLVTTVMPSGGSVSLIIHGPSGSTLWSDSVSASASWQLPQIPVTGTYTLLVRHYRPAAVAASLVLSAPGVGAIAVDGPEVQFQSSVAGQAGRFLFAGNAGDLLGLGVTALATTPANGTVNFYVYKPDGNTLCSLASSVPWSLQLTKLPTTGVYTIKVAPSGTATVAASFLLSSPITGALATDGTPTTYQTTRVGQSGRYAFAGTAGERFTIQLTAGSTYPNGIAAFVYKPDGTTLTSIQLYSSYDRKLDLGALPVSGNYTVALIPQGTNTGQVVVRLVPVASDTLTIGDAGKTLTLGPAQNGRDTFTGTAGEYIGLAATTVATVPAGGSVAFQIFKPDGTTLWNTSTVNPNSWQVTKLPVTGTYTLVVAPTGTASAAMTLMLSAAITGTLAPDGTTTTHETARPGQPGRYTFTGTAGQRFTMQATAGSTFSTYGASLSVFQPNGTYVGYTQFSPSTDVKLDLGALPASGTYTVVIVPSGLKTGTVAVRLVPVASDTLTIGDVGKALTLVPAQSGRYTFTGAAGDLLNLVVSGVVLTPAGGAVNYYVYKPDGTQLWSGSSSVTAATWQLAALPVAGTYTLAVLPPGVASASVTVRLTRR